MPCLLFFFRLIKVLCVVRVVSSMKVTNGTEPIPRTRRAFDTKYLVFPQGSNVQLVYCLTVVNEAKPSGYSTFGVTAGQAWELPSDSEVFRKFAPEVYHRRSRRELYRKMESLLGTRGRDGKACVLKAICNAAARNRAEVGKGGFLEEILHTVFTLPESFDDTDPETEYERAYFRREDCEQMEDRCPDIFSTFWNSSS